MKFSGVTHIFMKRKGPRISKRKVRERERMSEKIRTQIIELLRRDH